MSNLTDIELLEVALQLEKYNELHSNEKYVPHIRSLLCEYLVIEDSYNIVPMTYHKNSYVMEKKKTNK